MGHDLALAVVFTAAIGTLVHLYHDPSVPGDLIPRKARLHHMSVISGSYMAEATLCTLGNGVAPAPAPVAQLAAEVRPRP